MLSFEEKKSIFISFHFNEKMISKERVNFEYPESKQSGNVIARELSQSGNGYLLGKYMSKEIIEKNGYKVDSRGWISIKNFSKDELIKGIKEAVLSMSGKRIEPNILLKPKKEENHSSKEVSFPSSSIEKLIRSCLYNWLGYGNVNGQIWIMGMEEGGAEIWRCKTKTLEQSLKLRSTFELEMDFKDVWEDLYNIPLETFKGPNVWRYVAVFILEFEGKESNPVQIFDYIFVSKQLGRRNANHFMCEYMPLPKQTKNSIEPYQSIWKTVGEYCEEVEQARFSLIKNTLVCSDVKVMVSYDQNLTTKLLLAFGSACKQLERWNYGNETYVIYRLDVEPEQTIYLLSTPFFGNGRISYEGLKLAAHKMRSILS